MSVSPNKPPLDTMKRSILNFVRGLVPFWLYRDFQFLLSPCCTSTATLTIVCAGKDNQGNSLYNVTLALSQPFELPNGYLSLSKSLGSIAGTPVPFSGTSYTWTGVTKIGSSGTITTVTA